LRDFHTLCEYLYCFWVEMNEDFNYWNSRIHIFSNLQIIFMNDPALVLVILYFWGAVLCHEFRFPHYAVLVGMNNVQLRWFFLFFRMHLGGVVQKRLLMALRLQQILERKWDSTCTWVIYTAQLRLLFSYW
jgi:hypothetical protein